MVKRIAKGVVGKLNTIYPRTELECVKMEYGIELLLDNMIVLFFILLAVSFVGFFKEALLTLVGFSTLRISAGGLHFKKRIGCILGTGTVTILGGWIAYKHVLSFKVTLILLLIDIVVMIVFAPSGTSNNPINPKYYNILKIRSVVTVLIYVFLIFYFRNSNLYGMLSIGASCEAFTILPWINKR